MGFHAAQLSLVKQSRRAPRFEDARHQRAIAQMNAHRALAKHSENARPRRRRRRIAPQRNHRGLGDFGGQLLPARRHHRHRPASVDANP
jgi:hypothetical protein